jgi:tRNA nucleotidyltransferase (CCA-adding enzyme)
MSDILAKTLSKVIEWTQPSYSETKKLKIIAEQTKALVSTYRSPKIVGIVFGGSFAKGTWLKDDADIDIFVKIAASTSFQEFEVLAKQIGFESLRKYKPDIRYSSHPYVEAFVRGIRINVVPCYDVEKGKWKSAADRSPFHTQYIKDNLDEEKKKQVRLLKKFLKGIRVYGAEIATNGFSGYVTEVLILKYGSFKSVLEEISNLKEVCGQEKKHVISIEMADEDVIRTFNSHLIIVDPVDTRRNLGAAISAQSIGRFVLAARAFLEKPSLDFFIESKTNRKDLTYSYKRLYPNLLVIEFSYSKRSPDVIWGQLKRSLNAVSKQLKLADFKVIRAACSTDEKKLAVFVFLLESLELWPYRERIGPQVFSRNATTSFIAKNEKESLFMWIDDEMKIRSLIKRKETFAKHYLNSMLSEHIESSGITMGLKTDMQQSVQIYTGEERKIKGITKDALNRIIAKDLIVSR